MFIRFNLNLGIDFVWTSTKKRGGTEMININGELVRQIVVPIISDGA